MLFKLRRFFAVGMPYAYRIYYLVYGAYVDVLRLFILGIYIIKNKTERLFSKRRYLYLLISVG